MIALENARPLIDSYGRRITYLRLSVTDRCNLRCTYCMGENVAFEPKAGVLTLEELETIANAFIARGVRKLRITGGEPLVRRDVIRLFEGLSRRLADGTLDELTLTTNATRLAEFATQLKALGVERVNVSLDTLDRKLYARLARRDALAQALDGVEAALDAGLKVKINTVALKNANLDEMPDLIAWAHGKGMDLSLIEVMPLGDVGVDRTIQHAPLDVVRRKLERRWTLEPIDYRTGGPARYVRVAETGGRLGFITPLTQNFCDGCNRVRLTCTGQLYLCLGQEARADLRSALRTGGRRALGRALDHAMARKPKGNDFAIDRRAMAPATPRFMSATGG